jgi:hypothetical protein
LTRLNQTVKVDRDPRGLADSKFLSNSETRFRTIRFISGINFLLLPENPVDEANYLMLLVLGALVYSYFSTPKLERVRR